MPGRRLAASQVRLISVARRQLGLEDGDYRAILRRVAGVSSATALDQAGLDRVVAELERLGFRRSAPKLGHRPGFASPAALAKLRHLWRQYTAGEGDDLSLSRWLERQGWATHLRFLSHENSQLALGALAAMAARRQAPAA